MRADAIGLLSQPERRLKPELQQPTRREFLLRAGGGIGGLALAAIMAEQGTPQARAADGAAGSAANPLAPRKPHFEPQARRMIHSISHLGPAMA